MTQESGERGKGIFFDKVNQKVSILQGVSFELIHDLLEASGSEVTYSVAADEGYVVADCEIDQVSYCVLLLDTDGDPVKSIDKLGDEIILRLVLQGPESVSSDTLMGVANSWNMSRISGRSFVQDGLLFYEFRISLKGITSDYFEDHIFEWYDSIAEFINFVADQGEIIN